MVMGCFALCSSKCRSRALSTNLSLRYFYQRRDSCNWRRLRTESAMILHRRTIWSSQSWLLGHRGRPFAEPWTAQKKPSSIANHASEKDSKWRHSTRLHWACWSHNDPVSAREAFEEGGEMLEESLQSGSTPAWGRLVVCCWVMA